MNFLIYSVYLNTSIIECIYSSQSSISSLDDQPTQSTRTLVHSEEQLDLNDDFEVLQIMIFFFRLTFRVNSGNLDP